MLVLAFTTVTAQKPTTGTITGTIVDKESNVPIEFATVMLQSATDSAQIRGTTTDVKGRFSFDKVNYGKYKISYSFIGFEKQKTDVITLNEKNRNLNAGILGLSVSSQEIKDVEVTGKRSTFVNAIDRKTFNVGEDLMSKTGSLSDLLQNVPSLQVDIDGNVSLRGSSSVTILINGKPSAMMNLNRAAVLQQIPANTIEKVEIITNPSAKYKPDGTSGIINIVLKKNKNLGMNGNVSANVGNEGRYNGNVAMNYNPGKINLFGNLGIRQDDRKRINDIATQTYSNGVETSSVINHSESHGRPISYIAGLGADLKIDDKNKIGLSGNYNYRYQEQSDQSVYTVDSASVRQEDYNRNRFLPETESDLEFSSFYQHSFGKEGHELNVNYTKSHTTELEDNYYTNTYRIPASEVFYDNMFYHHSSDMSQLLVEYSNPLSKDSKLEAGYEFDNLKNDMDLHRDTTGMNQPIFATDSSRSNRFIRKEMTNVLYVTYEKEYDKFSYLVGLREEFTTNSADLVSKNQVINTWYNRLYPSLHTSYKFSELHELQFNYSHRIRRPEDEELNPFPEYQDLRNIRQGNPYLKPEDIHSFELGYKYKKGATTFLSTVYTRFNYNGITSITHVSGDTLISTLENLAESKSAGLELILSTSIGKLATINLSSNTFYNTIDASALGYSSSKSTVSLLLSGSVGVNLSKSTVWQINSIYTGKQLTPQGERLPSFVLNTGFKQEVFRKKAAIILTVSDVFNSLTSKSIIDTPDLQRQENRKRTARIIYCGFTYNFGSSGKKQNGETLKYDNKM